MFHYNNYSNTCNHTFKKSEPLNRLKDNVVLSPGAQLEAITLRTTASVIKKASTYRQNSKLHTDKYSRGHKSTSNTITYKQMGLRWAEWAKERLQSDVTYWLHSPQMDPHPPHHLGKLEERELRKERKKQEKRNKKGVMIKSRKKAWE